DEFVTVDAQAVQIEPGNVQMPGVPASGIVRRQFQIISAAQLAIVSLRLRRPPLHELIQLMKLMNADSRLNIAQVVFEAVGNDVVVPFAVLRVTVPRILAGAVERKDAHALGEFAPPRGEHAPFSRGQVFGGVETEGYGIAGPPAVSRCGSDGAAVIISSG